MTTGDLIRSLGGPTSVAAALGLRVQAVGNWTMRGAIPRRHHLSVWRLATKKRVAWTPPDADGLALVPAEDLPDAARDSLSTRDPPSERRRRAA
jgi:hypothetical protein